MLGEGPLKNTLQHTHEIREATQSHSDEIMISNGTSSDREPVPAKAAGKSVGTLYHQPAVNSLMLFITPPAVTDSSKGNLILETFLKGMKSDAEEAESGFSRAQDTPPGFAV